jgi:hypothetical protein
MSTRSFQSFPVWDLPTRWFHWINFVCVLSLAAIGTAILFEKELGLTDRAMVPRDCQEADPRRSNQTLTIRHGIDLHGHCCHLSLPSRV